MASDATSGTSATLRTPGEARALDRSLLRGVAWTAAAKWVAQSLGWVCWLVVARVLSPEDYGLVGMAAVYLGLITLLSEFGLGTAVLSVRDLSDEQLSQLNGLAVLLGAAGVLVSCALAVPLGRFFRAPELPLIVVAMSTTFLIASFKTVPLALLQRDLRFRALALVDLSQAVVLGLSVVAAALAGFRYWALVCSAALGALVSTGAILRLRRVPFARPRPAVLQHAVTLSADVVIARLCWYTSANTGYLVAGRVLGKVALGSYSVAWILASIPVDRVTALIGQVTPAFFSAVQRDLPAIRRYLLRITEGVGLITFPISVGLALVARDFVLVVLGAKWEPTIVPLQVLAAYAAFRSLTPLLPQVLMVLRDTRFEMWRMVAAAVLMPTAFYVGGQQWGIGGIAMAWVFVDPVLSVTLYRRVFSRIELSASAYLSALWPALSATALMAAAVLAVAWATGGESASVRLATQVGAGVLTYALACLGLHRRRFAAFAALVLAARRGAEGRP